MRNAAARMLTLLAGVCVGLVVPSPVATPVVAAHPMSQQVASSPQVSAAMSPFPDADAPATTVLLSEETREFTEEERDAARQKGLLVLAFGILPSLWASGLGIPGAFDKDKATKK